MLQAFDWVVIVVYFLAVFGVAIVATRRERSTRENSAGYFLGGRNVGWFVIGASLFASNIGSEHLVGLAESGAKRGVVEGQFEVLASLILILLAWVFVPFYVRSRVYTMPEFLERRYSAGARWYLSIVSIIAYVLVKISVTIAAGGIVFTALGVDFWTGATLIVAATAVYTVFGGLRAVLYTDLIQTFILIGGAIAVTVLGLYQLGGWSAMVETVEPGFMSMWKPISDPRFPWTGILFGAPILGVWYWCTDQFIVQRVLAAKGVKDARRGALFGGALKLLPVFIFVIPGVVAYSLAAQGKLDLPDPKHALPALVQQLMPIGIRGLIIAGLLAALMSSLSSVFNSCSTLVTLDIYKKLRPEATERQLVKIGQLATLGLVILGFLWTPIMRKMAEDGLFKYIQSIQAYISPPIAVVFLLGIFWKRLNAKGAMASLWAGFALGVGRLVLEVFIDDLGDGIAYYFASMNFLHFAIFLFLICAVIHVVVSLMTPPLAEEQIAGLTMQTLPPSADIAKDRPQRKDFRFTGLIIAGVGATWFYFSEFGQSVLGLFKRILF